MPGTAGEVKDQNKGSILDQGIEETLSGMLINFLSIRQEEGGVDLDHTQKIADAIYRASVKYQTCDGSVAKTQTKKAATDVGLVDGSKLDQSIDMTTSISGEQDKLVKLMASLTNLNLEEQQDYSLLFDDISTKKVLGTPKERVIYFEHRVELSKHSLHYFILMKLLNTLSKDGGDKVTSYNTRLVSGLLALLEGNANEYFSEKRYDLKVKYRRHYQIMIASFLENLEVLVKGLKAKRDELEVNLNALNEKRKQKYEGILDNVLVYDDLDQAIKKAGTETDKTVLYFNRDPNNTELIWLDCNQNQYPLEVSGFIKFMISSEKSEIHAGSSRDLYLSVEQVLKMELWLQVEQYKKQINIFIQPIISQLSDIKNTYVVTFCSGEWQIHHYNENGQLAEHISLQKILGLEAVLNDIPKEAHTFKPEEDSSHKTLEQQASSLIRQQILNISREKSVTKDAKQRIDLKNQQNNLRNISFDIIEDESAEAGSSSGSRDFNCYKLIVSNGTLKKLYWHDWNGERQEVWNGEKNEISAEKPVKDLSEFISAHRPFKQDDEHYESKKAKLSKLLEKVNPCGSIDDKEQIKKVKGQLDNIYTKHFLGSNAMFKAGEQHPKAAEKDRSFGVKFSTFGEHKPDLSETFLIDFGHEKIVIYWYNLIGKRREVPTREVVGLLNYLNSMKIESNRDLPQAKALAATIENLEKTEELSTIKGFLSFVDRSNSAVEVSKDIEEFFSSANRKAV